MLIPAGSIEQQKKLAKYKTKKQLADSLHSLRFTIGLKIPKPVKAVLKWMAEMNGNAKVSNGVGAFYHSEQTIANEIGCSLSTVERAVKWLKSKGLLTTIRTWNYAEDKAGSAYKVLADAKTCKIIIEALVKKDEKIIEKIIKSAESQMNEIIENLAMPTAESEQIDRKLTGTMTGTMTGNKRPLEKTSITKDKSLITGPISPALEIVLNDYKNFSNNERWNAEEKAYLSYWIEQGIKEAEGNIKSKTDQGLIKKAIGQVINSYSYKKPVKEFGRLMKAAVIKELEENELREAVKNINAAKEQLAASKQTRGRKKPIRTEILPDWMEKHEEERRRQDEERERLQRERQKDPVYIAEQKKRISEMLAALNQPQSQETAVQSI